MTRTLGVEWADRRIRVNVVAPSYVKTGLTERMRPNDGLARRLLDGMPLGRFGVPEEIGALTAFPRIRCGHLHYRQIFTIDGGI